MADDDRTRAQSWTEDDLVLRALRGLPTLAPPQPDRVGTEAAPPPQSHRGRAGTLSGFRFDDRRIQARATALFLETAARHTRSLDRSASRRASGGTARRLRALARPILPLSVAGFAVVYLIWAFTTAASFLP